MLNQMISVLETTIACRKADTSTLTDLCSQKLETQGLDFSTRQQIRCSKQKRCFEMLRNNWSISPSLKNQCIKLISLAISGFDPEIDIVFCPQSDYSNLSFEVIQEMFKIFSFKIALPHAKTNSILQENNATFFQEFLKLAILHTRNSFQNAITLHNQKQALSKTSILSQSFDVKKFRFKTQVKQQSKKYKDEKLSQRQQFEKQHMEYLKQSRKTFISKFDEEECRDKIYNLLIELKSLNQKNYTIIQKYALSIVGTSSSLKMLKPDKNLYSKQEKDMMIKNTEKKINNQEHIVQALPSYGCEEKQLKKVKRNLIQRHIKMEKYLSLISHLKFNRKPVNSWLPIQCHFKNSMENKIQLTLYGEQNNIKATKEKLFELLSEWENSESCQKNRNKRLYYSNQIVGCFSRKKIKQFLDSMAQRCKINRLDNGVSLPRISSFSPVKTRQTFKSIQTKQIVKGKVQKQGKSIMSLQNLIFRSNQ